MSLDHANEVRVILDGKVVGIVESYSVSISMFAQPAAFSVQLGHAGLISELRRKFPAGTPFELQIAGTTQFDGRTDGWSIQAGGGGPTSIVLTGRDTLAALHDQTARAEKSYSDVSLVDLTTTILDEVYGAGNYTLAASNAANRKRMSKAPGTVKKTGALTFNAVTGKPDDFGYEYTAAAASRNRKIQVKLGEKLYGDVLKPQLNRAGLFLWSTQGGTFILSELDTDQAPLYRLRHRRGDPVNTIISSSFRDDTTNRYARCEVWGRRGGGKEARTAVSGEWIDTEMVGLNITKSHHMIDHKATTIEQCEFLAKRQIAMSRRDGWSLSYTVAGHVTRSTQATGDVIWIPDTIVDVDDDELDVRGPHYLEGVQHNGSTSGTTSTIKLCRPDDLVFGEGAEE